MSPFWNMTESTINVGWVEVCGHVCMCVCIKCNKVKNNNKQTLKVNFGVWLLTICLPIYQPQQRHLLRSHSHLSFSCPLHRILHSLESVVTTTSSGQSFWKVTYRLACRLGKVLSHFKWKMPDVHMLCVCFYFHYYYYHLKVQRLDISHIQLFECTGTLTASQTLLLNLTNVLMAEWWQSLL